MLSGIVARIDNLEELLASLSGGVILDGRVETRSTDAANVSSTRADDLANANSETFNPVLTTSTYSNVIGCYIA